MSTGWICPKCGAGLSPSVTVCPNDTGHLKNDTNWLAPYIQSYTPQWTWIPNPSSISVSNGYSWGKLDFDSKADLSYKTAAQQLALWDAPSHKHEWKSWMDHGQQVDRCVCGATRTPDRIETVDGCEHTWYLDSQTGEHYCTWCGEQP